MVGDAPPSAATEAKRFAWSIYDFANSEYTTVVLTTVFKAYFVAVVAGGRGVCPLLAVSRRSIHSVIGNLNDRFRGKQTFRIGAENFVDPSAG